MIADGHFCIVLNGEVIVAEQRIADGRMRAVVEKDRPLKKAALAHFADELREDFRAVRSLIFRQLAVTLAQLVRAQLNRLERRITGAEQLPRKDFFFFGHRFLPPVYFSFYFPLYPNSLPMDVVTDSNA